MDDLQAKLKSFSGPVEQALPCAFDKYVLLHRLATGGMGTVFVARTGGISGIQKLCVIKTLRSHFAADADYVVRFMDEARVVVALDHRNICRVSDVGHADGRYFMAMEYIRGTDLRAVWRRYAESGRAVPEAIALYLLSESLEALDYAHHLTEETTGLPLQLVHRDISPQNIMVGYQGEVKVIDFGLAASTLKIEKTAPQVVMGKVGYMSPEQARGDAVDHLTDQFAAGVVLYELLTGERFYEGMGAHQIWAVVGTGEYRPPRLDALPPDARVIVERALHPDPSQRFASCSAFRQALLDLAYQRGYRVGGPEVREAMHQMFAVELAKQRELVASFAQMDDILPESGPALAAAGRAEQEATQTATDYAGSTERQDTGETQTERVAPGQLQIVEDDVEPAPPRARSVGLAAGLGLIAVLLMGVAAALVLGDEAPAIPSPPPPVTSTTPGVAPRPAPETPETALATTDPAPPTPTSAPPAVDTPEAVPEVASATPAAPTATAPDAPPTAKSESKRKRRGKIKRRSRRSGKAKKPPTRTADVAKAKPPPKPKPPAGKGKHKAKIAYLKTYCPKLSCTRWLSSQKISFDTPTTTLAKFRTRPPQCLKQCTGD